MGPPSRFVIVSQFAITVAARPAAPAISNPIPRGSATPLNTKTAPITNSALLTTATTPPIAPCSKVLIVSQFAATVVASPIAPATISPKPSGTLAPLNAKIAPKTNNAPESRPTTAPTGPCSASLIVSQFAAMTVAIPAAPTAISARPSGMFAPENRITAPITSSAKLKRATTAPIGPCSIFLTVSQLAATTDARPIAPATINPKPNGMFAPENKIIAPMASNATDRIAVTTPIGPCSSFAIAPQSVFTAPQIAAAPKAIRVMPTGILAPENVKRSR